MARQSNISTPLAAFCRLPLVSMYVAYAPKYLINLAALTFFPLTKPYIPLPYLPYARIFSLTVLLTSQTKKTPLSAIAGDDFFCLRRTGYGKIQSSIICINSTR